MCIHSQNEGNPSLAVLHRSLHVIGGRTRVLDEEWGESLPALISRFPLSSASQEIGLGLRCYSFGAYRLRSLLGLP